MPLPSLPSELILLISSHLPQKSLCSLFRTSRRLFRVLTPLLLDSVFRTTPRSWSCALSWVTRLYGSAGLLRALRPNNHTPSFNINYQDGSGTTSLHAACALNDVLTTYILLDHGASPNSFDMSGETPLHWATQYGREDTVKLLLQEGADPNVRSMAGDTPLVWAVKYGYEGIVKALIDHGADLNATVTRGETPLFWAASQGFDELVAMLLCAGADPELGNWQGKTALLVAAEAGHGAVVRRFLERGTNVDGGTGRGDTALVVAARHGHQDVVRMLLEGGGSAGRKRVGETTLFMAEFYGGTGVKWVMASRARRFVGRIRGVRKGSPRI